LVKIWDLTTFKETRSLKGHEIAATGVVFTQDGTKLLSIGFDKHLRMWNVADGKELKKLGPTPDDPYGIAFSRDGKLLVTSGYGGNVIIWDLATSKSKIHKLKFGAYCVAFSPDGKAVVTGHDDKTCYITSVGTP
ncbi:MAG TPA: hypothetical protein VKI65_09300, partial [Gemmataceae bacterium]|nr:hypothetical protein [Gemmataceae bacterium]